MIKQTKKVAVYFLLCLTALTLVLLFPQQTEPAVIVPVEQISLPVIEPVATATVPLKLKSTPVVAAPISELEPTLKRICSCESNGHPNGEPRQFNADGTVLKGKINPLDTGMCQINLKYHESTAMKMGLDLFTAEGNFAYATWLFETQGTTPWNWSRSCWQ